MAKECLIQKQRRQAETWERLHQEQLAIDQLPKSERDAAQAEFDARRVKNRQFKSRRYNRCAMTGRSRGIVGYFGIARQVFREKAHKGELPGVKKSSW